MIKLLKYLSVIVAVMVLLGSIAKWIDFWISRSMFEWIAFGIGIPIGTIVAFFLWISEDSHETIK